MAERQKFEVVERFADFELRHYSASLQIETRVTGDFLSAGNRGFRPLVGFISGENQTRQKIAMTAPVIQEPKEDATHLVRFVLPEGFSERSVPMPLSDRVKVISVHEHLAAVRVFGGSWNEFRFRHEGDLLMAAITREGLEPVGELYWSRFDPPWKPGFLKRNEVAIRIRRWDLKD